MGSLYRPRLIKVIGWTTCSPFPRRQRNSSLLRVGNRTLPNVGAALRAAISRMSDPQESPLRTATPTLGLELSTQCGNQDVIDRICEPEY